MKRTSRKEKKPKCWINARVFPSKTQRWEGLTWLCRYLHFSDFNTSLIPYSVHSGPSGEISTSLPHVWGGVFHAASVPLFFKNSHCSLACTADRTFRTFRSRKGRATARPNPLFVASQQYPQQLNMMWYRKECDFRCQKLVKDWEAQILLSCSYLQQWCMYEANEIHTSEICRERGCFLTSVVSVSGYTFVITTKHSKG